MPGSQPLPSWCRAGNIHLVYLPIELKAACPDVNGGGSCAARYYGPVNRAINRGENGCVSNSCINRHAIPICLHTDRIGYAQRFLTVEAISLKGCNKTLRQQGEDPISHPRASPCSYLRQP